MATRASTTAATTDEGPKLGLKFLEKTYLSEEGIWSTRISLEMGPQGAYAGPHDIVAPENATDAELAQQVAKAWGLEDLAIRED